MSILIKGMEMPKNCLWCPLQYIGICQVTKKDVNSDLGRRADDCPLVELPEKHGRLVEFIDVATTTDEDTGTETVNLGEAFAAYFKMRESKPVIEAEENK